MTTTIRDALGQQAQQRANRPGRLLYETPAGPLWSAAAIAEQAAQREPLVQWLVWQAATLAHGNRDQLAELGAAGPAWLRDQLVADRDAAGIVGRAVHHALDARILDTPVAPPTPEQAPFVTAFERFDAAHTPKWDAAALTVAHLDGPGVTWAGLADFFAEIDGEMVIGDFTTARRVDVAALKLVGLSMCDTAWLRDGSEVQPPEVAGGVIVHLRPDLYPAAGYKLIFVDLVAGIEAEVFEHAARLVHARDRMGSLTGVDA